MQPITQTKADFLPYWCRMKKSSVRRISCITYTTEGKISGKMAGVKIVTIYRCPSRHHRTRIASGGLNCFSTGIENHRRWFKWLLEKPVASNGQRPARISCKACKCCPPFSARVPAMMKTISCHRLPVEAKTPMIPMDLAVYSANSRPFILCNYRTRTGKISGKMTDGMKLKVVRKKNKAVYENH